MEQGSPVLQGTERRGMPRVRPLRGCLDGLGVADPGTKERSAAYGRSISAGYSRRYARGIVTRNGPKPASRGSAELAPDLKSGA